MPIYEYRCPNGHTFEVFQRMTDPPVSVCETCGAGPVEKLLFPVAVHFKGSGFYSTDYGRGSRKGAGKDGETSTSSSDGSAKQAPRRPSEGVGLEARTHSAPGDATRPRARRGRLATSSVGDPLTGPGRPRSSPARRAGRARARAAQSGP